MPQAVSQFKQRSSEAFKAIVTQRDLDSVRSLSDQEIKLDEEDMTTRFHTKIVTASIEVPLEEDPIWDAEDSSGEDDESVSQCGDLVSVDSDLSIGSDELRVILDPRVFIPRVFQTA